MASYDFVVAGGGAAGCVLAARLSEDPATRVALIEAGPGDGPASMSDPEAWFGLWGSTVDWVDQTTPQGNCGGAVHAWPRGKVLGGSSGINGMIHLRGHRSVSWTDRNIVDGRRQSAADAYLWPAIDRPNLTIVTDAHVKNISRCAANWAARARTHRPNATVSAFGKHALRHADQVNAAAHARNQR